MTEEEMQHVYHASTWRATRCRATSTSSTSFPMNAAGKILKYKMREDAVARLGLSEN